MKGRDKEPQAPGGPTASPWRRVLPLSRLGLFMCVPECRCVREFMGPRLPCWGTLGRRCLRGKAFGPQWVRRPGCRSAELTILRACMGRSESPRGRWAPEGLSWRVASVCMFKQSYFSLASFPIPSPQLPIPRLERASGAHPLFWARGPALRPLSSATKFICNKRERGASSQEGGSGIRSGSAREGGLAGGRRVEERSARILPQPGRAAMLPVAPSEAGAGPGGRC